MQIVIVAGRHEIDGMRIHQGGARCLIGMDDRNYEIGPRRASAFGVGKDRRYRRREDEIFRTRDACRCFVGGAYEGEPKALRLDRNLILMMWQRQPCGIPEIGGKDRETGLSYPVEINLLAEVELMPGTKASSPTSLKRSTMWAHWSKLDNKLGDSVSPAWTQIR